MNQAPGRDLTTVVQASPVPPPRDDSSPRLGCLRVAGKVALVLGGLAALAFVALYITLQQAFKAPQAVAPPIAWTSRDIVLLPDRPVLIGQLTLTAKGPPTTDLRVGLNAGVPSATAVVPSGSGAAIPSVSAAPPAPAALLAGPSVRVSVTTAGGTPQSCFAPCELQLSSQFDCESGTCRITFEVTVEREGETERMLGPVTVGISGGATAPLTERLPVGLDVDLALDSSTVPSGN